MSISSFEYKGYYLATRSNVFIPICSFIAKEGYKKINSLDKKVELLISDLRKEGVNSILGFVNINLENYIDSSNEKLLLTIVSDTLTYIKSFKGFIPNDIIKTMYKEGYSESHEKFPTLLDTEWIEGFLALLEKLISESGEQLEKYEENDKACKKVYHHVIRSLD